MLKVIKSRARSPHMYGIYATLVKGVSGWAGDHSFPGQEYFVLAEMGPFRSIEVEAEQVELLDQPLSAFVFVQKRRISSWLSYVVNSIWQIDASVYYAKKKYDHAFNFKQEALYAGKGEKELATALSKCLMPGEREICSQITDLRVQKQYLRDWGQRLQECEQELEGFYDMDHGLAHSSLRVRGFPMDIDRYLAEDIAEITSIASPSRRIQAEEVVIDSSPDTPSLTEKEELMEIRGIVGLDLERVGFLVDSVQK